MLATASNGVSFRSLSTEGGRFSERIFSLILVFITHDQTSKSSSDQSFGRVVGNPHI